MTERAYLAVLQWPDSMDHAAQAAAITTAAGLDPYIAAQAARRGAPQIVARLEPDAADRGAAYLHSLGATAMAATQSQMAAPEPARLKRLTAAGPSYTCETWRAAPVTLPMADVFLMVRARLRSTQTRTRGPAPGGKAALYLGGPTAAALAYAAHAMDTPARSTQIQLDDLLDLWLVGGSRLRIDAARFDFDILGPDRVRLDRDNFELLVNRLRAQCPRALYDEGFADFRCPPEILRSHFVDSPGHSVRKTSEAPAFEFYSVWAWLMWRRLMAG